MTLLLSNKNGLPGKRRGKSNDALHYCGSIKAWQGPEPRDVNCQCVREMFNG